MENRAIVHQIASELVPVWLLDWPIEASFEAL
jgi:hypothetical protein